MKARSLLIIPLAALALAACTRNAGETTDGGNRISESDPSLPTTQTGTPADAEATNGMESTAGMTGATGTQTGDPMDPTTGMPPQTTGDGTMGTDMRDDDTTNGMDTRDGGTNNSGTQGNDTTTPPTP